jgi:hypothetical protein
MSEIGISVPPNVDEFVRFLGVLIFWSGRLEELAVPGSLRFSVTGSLVPVPLGVREV